MAKIKVIRNIGIIESEFSYEDIATLAKHSPAALVLKDEEGNTVYRAALGDKDGCITTAGVCYGEQADKTAKAAVVIHIPTSVKNPVEYIMEEVGTKLLKLNAIEQQYAAALEKVKSDLSAVEASITVVTDVVAQ